MPKSAMADLGVVALRGSLSLAPQGDGKRAAVRPGYAVSARTIVLIRPRKAGEGDRP